MVQGNWLIKYPLDCIKADWDFTSADYNGHSVEEHLNFQYGENSHPSLRAEMQTSDDRFMAWPTLAWKRRVSRSCTSLSATCDVAKMYINPQVRSAVMSASSRFYLGLPSIPHRYELHGRVCKNPTVCTVANRVYCGSNEAPSREEDKQEQSDHCWAEHSCGERMDGGPRLTIPFYILGSL